MQKNKTLKTFRLNTLNLLTYPLILQRGQGKIRLVTSLLQPILFLLFLPWQFNAELEKPIFYKLTFLSSCQTQRPYFRVQMKIIDVNCK
jgi:hypothetical protein